jgi:hypothetical protein
MKIGPSGFCMPVSSGCTTLRREAVFKKSANPSGVPCRGEVLPWVLPETRVARGQFDFRRFLDELFALCTTTRRGFARGKIEVVC